MAVGRGRVIFLAIFSRYRHSGLLNFQLLSIQVVTHKTLIKVAPYHSTKLL